MISKETIEKISKPAAIIVVAAMAALYGFMRLPDPLNVLAVAGVSVSAFVLLLATNEKIYNGWIAWLNAN